MELQENSLIAFFSTGSNAESCASVLKEAGINNVQIEMVSSYDTEQGGDLSKLVRPMTGLNISPLDTNILTDDDSRELMSGDPLIYSIGAQGSGSHAFVLSAEIDEGKADEAEKIIKEHGGQIR